MMQVDAYGSDLLGDAVELVLNVVSIRDTYFRTEACDQYEACRPVGGTDHPAHSPMQPAQKERPRKLPPPAGGQFP